MIRPVPRPARRALVAVLAVPALAHADAAILDGPITLVPPGREVSEADLAHDPSSGLAITWAEDGVAYLRLSQSDGSSPTTVVIDEPESGGPRVQLDALGGGLVQYYHGTGSNQLLGRRILPGRAGLGPIFPIVPQELPPGTKLTHATLAPNAELLQLGTQQGGCVPDMGCETSRLLARVRGPDNSEVASGVLFEVTGFDELETSDPGSGDIVAVPGGPFLMIYTRNREIDPDADIRLIAVGRDATLVAGPVQINSYTPGDQGRPRIALTPDGGFIAVWMSDEAPFPFPSLNLILGRRFDVNGVALGDDFQVAASIPGDVSFQVFPRIAIATDGSCLVRWGVWNDVGFTQAGQLLDADTTPIDAVLRLQAPYDATYTSPTVAVGPGRFLTTWRIDGRFLSPPGDDRVEGRTIQRVPWDRIFESHFTRRSLNDWDEVVWGPAL